MDDFKLYEKKDHHLDHFTFLVQFIILKLYVTVDIAKVLITITFRFL